MSPHLARFVAGMDDAVADASDGEAHADADRRAAVAADLLGELLRHPEFLEARHREPADDGYRQHVVHVHPQGRYSVVALVWRPGQATPVHDHVCWCVVGVLEGEESEARYHLRSRAGAEVLTLAEETTYGPGSVCTLVPPGENIHRVANAGDHGLTISIHVYGADIASLGTSIDHVFDQPVVAATADDDGPTLSWRASAGREVRSTPA